MIPNEVYAAARMVGAEPCGGSGDSFEKRDTNYRCANNTTGTRVTKVHCWQFVCIAPYKCIVLVLEAAVLTPLHPAEKITQAIINLRNIAKNHKKNRRGL